VKRLWPLTLLAALAIASPASAATVYGWGEDVGVGAPGTTYSSPTAVPDLAGASQIATNDGDLSFAVFPDGTVKTWGENGPGHGYTPSEDISYPTKPADSVGLTGVKRVAISHDHGLALMNDNSVKGWGKNNFGQVGIGSAGNTDISPTTIQGLTNVKALYAGDQASYALLNDGTVKAWGSDVGGQQGDGPTAADCAGISGYPCVSSPTTIPGLTNVKELGVAEGHVMALLNDGTVRVWGGDRGGALGDAGTPADTCNFNQKCSKAPIAVAGLTGVKSIGAGVYNGYAVLNDGTMRAWGRDDHGELGNGLDTGPQESCADVSQMVACSNTPVPVSGVQSAVRVDGDTFSAMALLADGTAAVWGLGLGLENTDANEFHSPVDTGLSGVTDFVIGGSETTHAYAIAGSASNPGGGNPGGGNPGGNDGGQALAEAVVKDALKTSSKEIKKEFTKLKPPDVAKSGSLSTPKLKNPVLGKITAMIKAAFTKAGQPIPKAAISPAAKKKTKKPIVVGTGSHVFPAPGEAKIKIKLTKAGKKLLAKLKSITLELTLTHTGANGKPIVQVTTVRLGKKPKK
jgi:hypothetical protein